VLAFDRDGREGLLRVMEDWCPPDLGELRATLPQQQVWMPTTDSGPAFCVSCVGASNLRPGIH